MGLLGQSQYHAENNATQPGGDTEFDNQQRGFPEILSLKQAEQIGPVKFHAYTPSFSAPQQRGFNHEIIRVCRSVRR